MGVYKASSANPLEHHVSAGGIVYRRQGDTLEVLLCGRLSPQLWGLPKGTPNPGEELEETALREVREETGITTAIEAPLGSISYWFQHNGVRVHKTVHFYLMSPTGGNPEQHDPEFDVVQWFPIEEALKNLTYANEAKIVRKASKIVCHNETDDQRTENLFTGETAG